jgi:hypothetical protein
MTKNVTMMMVVMEVFVKEIPVPVPLERLRLLGQLVLLQALARRRRLGRG